jgi:hypothetical protein
MGVDAIGTSLDGDVPTALLDGQQWWPGRYGDLRIIC